MKVAVLQLTQTLGSMLIPSATQCTKMSYQEQTQVQMMKVYSSFFNNIRHSYQRCPTSPVYQKLTNQYTLMANSLMASAHAFLRTIKETQEQYIFMVHLHYQSHSPLLAVYCRHHQVNVEVVGTRRHLRNGWGNCLVSMCEVDKQAVFKSLMQSEGVNIRYYQSKQNNQNKQESKEKDQQQSMQIFDIFNTHPTVYEPTLYQLLNQKGDKKCKRVIYMHPSQIEQAKIFLQRVHGREVSIQIVEHNAKFPCESSTLTQSKFEQQILSFLNEEVNHPNKQDIIIFHPPTENFVKRIKNLLKKNPVDLLKVTKIIDKANQDIKSMLPPAPAFISTTTPTPCSPTLESPKQKPQQIQAKSPKISKNQSLSIIKQVHNTNNIFIVPNFKTLIQWGYNISHSYYIFDFRKNQSFYFDYSSTTYIQSEQQYITQKQLWLRNSCIGIHKIGKYVYVNDHDQQQLKQNQQNAVQDYKAKDIGFYCLSLIQNGVGYLQDLVKGCSQVQKCITSLISAKIVERRQQKYWVLNKQVLQVLKKVKDLNPLLCANILAAKNSKQEQIPAAKLSLLLAISASIMGTQGSLRQASSNVVANRPTQIWRQTGYLHSSVDVIIRAKVIEKREQMIAQGKKSKKSVSRRLSAGNSQEYQVFGNLFQIVLPERITFDQMTIQDLLREQLVNQQIFHKIVQFTQKICDALELQDFAFTSFEDIQQILQILIQSNHSAVGAYSGSRRIGYFLKNKSEGIFPSKDSLMAILNQRPPFIYISRLWCNKTLQSQNKYQISMCNMVPQTTILQCCGNLPSRKTNSLGQTQFQYHGVPSATIKTLWRNNGADIQAFQCKHLCFIQPNQQIALISIHCHKQKQNEVRNQFNALLTKTKQKIASQTKVMHYIGGTSLLIGSGGNIIQVIKDKYINKCCITNLDLSVEVQDLQELFQQFFNLKQIKIVKQSSSAATKTAYIEFHTQRDYFRFHEYYNECLYLDRFIKVSPIQSIPQESKNKQQMFLEFTWNAWKSHQKAVVNFQTEAAASSCLQALKGKLFDQAKVKIQIRSNPTNVYFQGLNQYTDQVFLESTLKNYGVVKSVQILKTPSKQGTRSLQSQLQEEIRKSFQRLQHLQDFNIVVKPVQKLKNGLRKCKVIFRKQERLNQVMADLQQKTGIMGVGRIHVSSWFIFPIKVTKGYLHLYDGLVECVLQKMQNNKIKIQNVISNDHEYIIAKSQMKQQIQAFKQSINQELQGYNVDLTGFESSILLTDVGVQNLIDLQEKYDCRLIPNLAQKTLVVVTKFQNVKTIKSEIKARVQDNFFYRISLTQKSFKHFKQQPQILQNMKKQYSLSQLSLQQVGRNLLLQGSANNVQKAFNYLMHLIESVSKPSQQQLLNMDVCGVCCQQPNRPYRLQQCGHKFCFQCLLDNATMALGDITMFPLKCPQCLVQIVITDLSQLLSKQMWNKLIIMSLNQFVGRHPQILSNCYTAGCKQVCFLIKTHFSCDECNNSFCTQCKLNYHPGLTCQQAKQDSGAAFERYMKQNGIRKCANAACKMPLQRIDGCYRVTCSKCNKSMCFKCEPDKMIAYDHYNDCYTHLTQAHGGYW